MYLIAFRGGFIRGMLDPLLRVSGGVCGGFALAYGWGLFPVSGVFPIGKGHYPQQDSAPMGKRCVLV